MASRSKVILDCDNSYGLFGCDIDDGLALLYLLGEPDVDLLGVTLAHGNTALHRVIKATNKLLRQAGCIGLPVHPGAQRGQGLPQRTRAAEFILEQSLRYPGDIVIVATGPLSNLATALDLDPNLPDRLKRIHVMGGLTEPLKLGRLQCRELNIAADPVAAARVLSLGEKIWLFPAQACLSSRIGLKEIAAMRGTGFSLRFQTLRWLICFGLKYGVKHIHPWDLLPALAVRHPELFKIQQMEFSADPADLAFGFLHPGISASVITATDLLDPAKALKISINTWRRTMIPDKAKANGFPIQVYYSIPD